MLGMTGDQVFRLLEDAGGCVFVLAMVFLISKTW
jgi:hypothetical protein